MSTYISGLTTFLVPLGTSAMVDKVASMIFYLRITQMLFVGLFAVAVGYLLCPEKRSSENSMSGYSLQTEELS